MKHLLLTTIAAVVLVGCGDSQQSAPAPEAKPVEPVAEAAKPEPPTAKAPDASLWDAAMFGKIEAAKKAIADGANVNAKKDDGETPLHWATVEAMDSGSKKVIELLIENGADVNAKIVDGRKKGMTPLAIANMFSNKEIADLLSKHGGKTGEELKAAGKTTEPVAEASQTKPATAKALDISIRRALFDGNIEAVKKHLASGADLNVKTKPTLSTPLHSAVMRNRIEMAELLITAGCEVNAKDFKGYTPLDIAIRRVRKPMADLLRKHGGKTGEELKAEGK